MDNVRVCDEKTKESNECRHPDEGEDQRGHVGE